MDTHVSFLETNSTLYQRIHHIILNKVLDGHCRLSENLDAVESWWCAGKFSVCEERCLKYWWGYISSSVRPLHVYLTPPGRAWAAVIHGVIAWSQYINPTAGRQQGGLWLGNTVGGN